MYIGITLHRQRKPKNKLRKFAHHCVILFVTFNLFALQRQLNSTPLFTVCQRHNVQQYECRVETSASLIRERKDRNFETIAAISSRQYYWIKFNFLLARSPKRRELLMYKRRLMNVFRRERRNSLVTLR